MSVEDDRIEQLKRKLYSRGEYNMVEKRSPLNTAYTPNPQEDWGDASRIHLPSMAQQSQKTHPFLKKFLIGAVLFFAVSVAIAGYVFFGGINQVSSSHVDITVVGPVSVGSGDSVDLGISIINQNSTDLNDVELTVEYPEGTQSSVDSSEPLRRTVEKVGTISAGKHSDITKKLFLFGDKGSLKTIVFKIQYAVNASNATFTKEKRYDITIGSSPIIMTISAPTEVNSGQQFTSEITVTSNTASVLKNIIVKAEYPYGFTYSTSSVKPDADKQTWNIGDLKNGEKKVFTVSGVFIGQDNEERTFRFMAGTNTVDGAIQPVLATVMPGVVIKKSFFDTQFSLQGDIAPVVSVVGNTRISGNIDIANALSDTINAVSAQLKITGGPVNKSWIIARNGGFYQSNTDTLTWDTNANSSLALITPGDKVSLSFDMQNFILPKTVKNPEINFELTLSGNRALSGGGFDTVSAVSTKKLRFLSEMTLSSRTLRSGVFVNTGPVPPQHDQPSTYTIEWTLANSYNDLTGTTVQTQLPAYVDWVGSVSPTNEKVSYSTDNRTVTWNVGTVSAGAGYTNSSKKVYFQVRLNPSASQIGISPELTGSIAVTAVDSFVQKNISTNNTPLNTNTADGLSGIVQ